MCPVSASQRANGASKHAGSEASKLAAAAAPVSRGDISTTAGSFHQGGPESAGTISYSRQFLSPVSPGPSRELNARVVASTVVEESLLSPPPPDFETREEFEVYEDRVIEVPVRQVVNRQPPPGSEVTREEVVLRPETHVIDRIVEVPEIDEVVTRVPVRRIIDVPKDVMKIVRVPEVQTTVKEVEVPGEIIEITHRVCKEIPKAVRVPDDVEVPVIVAQTLFPSVTSSPCAQRVTARTVTPVLVPVDIYIPKVVRRSLEARARNDTFSTAAICPAQYNAMLRKLNPHLVTTQCPFRKSALAKLYLDDSEPPVIHRGFHE